MSIAPPQIEYDRHCLVYCGDQFCTCCRGPLGRTLPLDVVRSIPRVGPPDDNFHHGSDFHSQLPEDGSPREFYVMSFLVSTLLFQTSPSSRSICTSETIDRSRPPLGASSYVRVHHRLRVRRRWLPIAQMPHNHTALLGCDRYPDKRYYGHSREIKPGSVFVQTKADGPRDWEATHFDRTTLREIVVRSEIAPHGAEHRVPR